MKNDIRIAYIISGYLQPMWLVRLVRRLHAEDHGFFIHYDLRSPESEYRQLIQGLKDLKNVTFLPRHRCYWGDFGHVAASLKGIHEIALRGFAYDYAILLTGQDYPVRSDGEIRARLHENVGKSFMEWAPWPIPGWERGRAIKRIENFHIHLPFPRWVRSLGWPVGKQHLSISMKRKIPGGSHPHFGSSYWYLHRSCLQYIEKYVSEHPEYVDFFQHAHIPDESFFQSLLMNSSLRTSVVPRTLTYVVWRPPWPGVLTRDDLPSVCHGDWLFARKFSPRTDSEVLDELDRRIDDVTFKGDQAVVLSGMTDF